MRSSLPAIPERVRAHASAAVVGAGVGVAMGVLAFIAHRAVLDSGSLDREDVVMYAVGLLLRAIRFGDGDSADFVALTLVAAAAGAGVGLLVDWCRHAVRRSGRRPTARV